MNELDKLLPMPPHFGPPLPSSFKVTWPWLKKPPERKYVLPIVEAPELVTEPQVPEAASQTEPIPAVAKRAINYEVETPPEIPPAGTPRTSSDWILV